MRGIFRQSYSTAQGPILEMYKEARHEQRRAENAPVTEMTRLLYGVFQHWYSLTMNKAPFCIHFSQSVCVCSERRAAKMTLFFSLGVNYMKASV